MFWQSVCSLQELEAVGYSQYSLRLEKALELVGIAAV